LGLIKYRNDNGTYCYINSSSQQNIKTESKYLQIIKNNIIKIDVALNIVVIKCYIGMAQAVCASIDEMNWNKNIIGTLAGDDTIFLVAKSERNAKFFEMDIKCILEE
ncbi:MAG: arginine repressor, partial [Oscillospiraceae bacterium]